MSQPSARPATLEASTPPEATRADLQQRIVIPGLINRHVHLIQSIMRGLAENMELHGWASCAIWPLEVAFRGSDGAVAARLAVAEMLKTGTTCFLEPMLPSYETLDFASIVDAVGRSGIRACLGKLVKIRRSDPSAGIPDNRDSLAETMSVEAAVAAHEAFYGLREPRRAGARVDGGRDAAGTGRGRLCGPRGSLPETRDPLHAARRRGLSGPGDDPDALQGVTGRVLPQIGATGSHVVLGLMVHLDEANYAILREMQTSVAHNPTSNAKLADGRHCTGAATAGRGRQRVSRQRRRAVQQCPRHVSRHAPGRNPAQGPPP